MLDASPVDIQAKEAGLRLVTRDALEIERRRQLAQVMREISELLGNIPAVVRKSYVYGALVTAFKDGTLGKVWRKKRWTRFLTRSEAVVGVLASA